MRSFNSVLIFLLAIAFCLIACGHNGSKVEIFSKDSLVSPKQEFAFRLDYLGQDTCSIEAVYEKDSQHIYRIKSFELPSIYQDSLLTKLVLDSTIDGGLTWSKNTEVSQVLEEKLPTNYIQTDNRFIRSFFVADSIKYIITTDAVVAFSKGEDFIQIELPSKLRSIRKVFFEADSNLLAIVTDNEYIRIQNGQPFVYDFSNRFGYESTYAFSSDTLYILTSNRYSPWELLDGKTNLSLIKIDRGGRNVWDDTVALNYSFGVSDNTLIVKKGEYYYVDNFKVKGSRDTVLCLISNDYGYTWKESSAFTSRIYKLDYFDKQGWLVNDVLTAFQVSNDFGKSAIATLSDSTILFDSIKSVRALPAGIANSFFILGIGEVSKRTYNHMFYPTIQPASFFGKLLDYSIEETPSKIEVSVRTNKTRIIGNKVRFRLFGASAPSMASGLLRGLRNMPELKININPANDDSTLWKLTFSPSSINLHPGEEYYLQLDYVNHGKLDSYGLKVRTFTPVSFYDKHPVLVTTLLSIGTILLFLITLFFYAPLLLYALYKKISFLRNLASATGSAGKIFELIDKLMLVPLFVLQPRVADAWVKKNKRPLIDRFEQTQTVIDHNAFIPLPMRVHSQTGAEISQPSPETMADLFEPERVCLEIVGVGGVGKTTLAVQIGKWTLDASNQKHFKKHLWLPIIVEEETEDIYSVIKRVTVSYTKDAIDDDFLKYLLRKQRILVIIDALSERSIEMQEHVRSLFGRENINALLITSRKELRIQTGDDVMLYPQTMDFVKVAEYVKIILSTREERVFQSESNRSKLSEKIVSIFSVKRTDFSENRTEVPIIPALPSLMMTQTINFVERNKDADINYVLQNMPSSIPEVFIYYIIAVNPKSGVNLFTDDDILKFAECIAMVNLWPNFFPKDKEASKILLELAKLVPSQTNNVIDRLVHNGILLPPRRYLTTTYIRFALDPLAECMAAIGWAKKCGPNKAKWEQLYRVVDEKKAYEFKAIVSIVRATYAGKFGWFSGHLDNENRNV